MAKKKKNSIEYRYYEIGQDEYVLALFGESWVRDYGRDVDGFHFHNLMEIGVCHEGHGEMGYEEGKRPYHPGTITVIPKIFLIRPSARKERRAFGNICCPKVIARHTKPSIRLPGLMLIRRR